MPDENDNSQNFPFEEFNVEPPSENSIRIIKYLLRGGKRGDKSPLVRDFQKIWVEKLGPEKYKDTVKELKQKRWIGISRDPSRRGRKAGKAVIYLIDRDCASKYIKYCQDKEVSDSELHHHSEHHSYLERKY